MQFSRGLLIGSALITMDSAVSGLSALSGIGAALEEQGLDGEAQARIVHQVTKQVPLQRLCEAINGAGRDLWKGLQAGGVSLPSISRALAAIMSAGDSPQTRSTAVRLCFMLLRIPDCPVRDWAVLHRDQLLFAGGGVGRHAHAKPGLPSSDRHLVHQHSLHQTNRR